VTLTGSASIRAINALSPSAGCGVMRSGREVLHARSASDHWDCWDDVSTAILDELTAHATQERFVYRHRWQSHDLVFWDNRSLQHQATGCPSAQRRKLYRTTVEGDVPF
jgi:hypothetical protein